MDRRNFIRLGAAGGVTALLAPSFATAGATSTTTLSTAMAGGIYYTASHPGRWSKKVKPHLPVIEKAAGKIQVITGHAMNAHAHYITKHMLLDSNFNFVAETLFDPVKHKAAKSIFDTSKLKGTIYVVSHCNKHDSWLNQITL